MGATCQPVSIQPSASFQSARPRWARRARAVRDLLHAPVSIRAPAMGATSCRRRPARASARFNPRARDGRDEQIWARPLDPLRFQSARPRWARLARVGDELHHPGFNPRARDGRDATAPRFREARQCFNPRARDGRDRCPRRPTPARSRFNPRARDGRDPPSPSFPARPFRFNPRARDGRDACSPG